jgi:hypothetical protein
MTIVRGPNIVNDGLVSCWDVGNLVSYPGSGTTLANLVGTDHLIINGSPTLTSTIPWYFTFGLSQTTKYLIDNPFTMPTTDVTIEMWVRFLTTDDDQALVSYAVSGDTNNSLIFLYNDKLRFYGPDTLRQDTDWEPSTNVWYQIVRSRVKSSGLEKLYVDGVEEFSDNWNAGDGFTTGGAMVFGQEQDSVGGGFQSSQCFGGDFSLLRLYDRALTAAEVLQNYNALKSRFGH